MKPDFRQPAILFGGSFDPVHEGHLHLAREALAAVPAARQLIFVPAAHSPGKASPSASAAQRLDWLRGVAEPSGYLVWDEELRRGGESYTADTLEEAHRLGASRDSLYWLLGADAYAGFPRWRSPERVRSLCRLLVATRPGQGLALQDPQDRLLSVPPHPASSAEIRARIAAGLPASPWLPASVRASLDKLLPPDHPYARRKE